MTPNCYDDILFYREKQSSWKKTCKVAEIASNHSYRDAEMKSDINKSLNTTWRIVSCGSNIKCWRSLLRTDNVPKKQ